MVMVLSCLKNSLRLFENCQTVLCIALLHAVHLHYYIATSILVLSFCFVNLKAEKITKIQQKCKFFNQYKHCDLYCCIIQCCIFSPIYSVKSFIVNSVLQVGWWTWMYTAHSSWNRKVREELDLYA